MDEPPAASGPSGPFVRSTRPSRPSSTELAPCGRLLPHALAVASWIERDRMEFAEAGRLLNQTAYYLYERGQYAEAEPLYMQAMEIRRTALGERHPDYATSLNNLAELYRAMGRHAEAEPLYRAGDGDSPHRPGRAAPRLRRLAEQPGGAVPSDGPARRGRAALPAGDGDSPHGPGRAAPRLRRLAEQPGGAVRRDGPARRGRAALPAGDGDSPHRPGRAAPRLRHLAEQPGGAVPTRWAGTPRPSRSTCRRWRFAAPPWASGTPTTPPR